MEATITTGSEQEAAHRNRVAGRRVLMALIAFFGFVTVVNIVMIVAAISTFGGLETRSSHQAGLDFAAEKARADAQDALGWTVDAGVDGTALDRVVEVSVADRNLEGVSGLEIVARFTHPADHRLDAEATLREVGIGTYRAPVELDDGEWTLRLRLERDGELTFRSENRLTLR